MAVPPLRARQPGRWGLLCALCVLAVGMQVHTDGAYTLYTPANAVQWVRSPGVMRRLALGFDALVADAYWIRAVQYYGGTRLSEAEDKSYDLLYPLLDITTTLDPQFSVAYRFGAILLSEGYPDGPGRPDQAIALLEKGIRASPDRWEYYRDAGFVHYLWLHDAKSASEWFLRGSRVPGAAEWLAPLAASVLAEGGERGAARLLWTQMAQTAEQDWLRERALGALQRLETEEVVDQLHAVVNRFYDRQGRFPTTWNEVVQAGLLRGVPVDATGVAFSLDPVSGIVDVAPESGLYPIRRGAPLREPAR